ncbi:MAG: tRNA threonylcarbamoyladenosine dehydratase [Prevotella sp.]|nr:tRNA threonylcarbamoyladenosine dehydratase [Prevotella sp.]
MLFGSEAVSTLSKSRVAVFGVGGVGGYAVEVLARSGVGCIHLIDNDRVSITNLNRQIVALHSTIGQYKVDVAEKRIHDINPACEVVTHKMFYLPENADELNLGSFDYVIDCIDTVSAKLEIIRRCHGLGVKLISSMGAANKFDATAFRVADIEKTTVDPLAKVIRKKLRKEGIKGVKVVFSEEEPQKSADRNTPASNAFVPAAAGLVVGAEVVKDIIRSANIISEKA